MAEFTGGKEEVVSKNHPIIFENKTDSDLEIGLGVVFHESGLYRVTIDGIKTTIVKEE